MAKQDAAILEEARAMIATLDTELKEFETMTTGPEPEAERRRWMRRLRRHRAGLLKAVAYLEAAPGD